MTNVREELSRSDACPSGAVHARRIRLHELDGLRGLMAFFVVIYHLQAPLPGVSHMLKTYCPVIAEAWFAVDVFFVMSGFVMMYVYGETFGIAVRPGGYLDFFKARFARLYPVHLFALAVMMLYFLPLLYDKADFLSIDGRYSWNSLILSLLMLHGPWMSIRTWNFPAWSISAEWHAYLLFPFLARFALRWSPVQSGLVIAAGVLIPFVLYLVPVGPDRYPTNSWIVVLRVVPLFICGMAVFRLNAVLQWRGFRTTLCAVAIIVTTVALLATPRTAPFAVFLTPPLVLLAINNPSLGSLLKRPLLKFLGRISYSLYMTHALVAIIGLGAWTRRLAAAFGIDAPGDGVYGWGAFAVAIIGSIVLGWLTCKFIEEPARAFITRTRVDQTADDANPRMAG